MRSGRKNGTAESTRDTTKIITGEYRGEENLKQHNETRKPERAVKFHKLNWLIYEIDINRYRPTDRNKEYSKW